MMILAREKLLRCMLPLLLLALLNGAMFNRIGPRIADHSYVKVFIYYISKCVSKDASTYEMSPVKYSKRSVPANQSSSGSFNYSNTAMDLFSIRVESFTSASNSAVKQWFMMRNGNVCKAYKNTVIKPPIG